MRRAIDGASRYTVDSEGNVYSAHGHRLVPHRDKDGYLHVSLRVEGRLTPKRFAVHQVVTRAFHGPRPSPEHQVRHLDGTRDNNTASNLTWGTPKQNSADRIAHGRHQEGSRNPRAKLSETDVEHIRAQLQAGFSQDETARDFGIGQSQVSRIARRVCWRKL